MLYTLQLIWLIQNNSIIYINNNELINEIENPLKSDQLTLRCRSLKNNQPQD